MSAPEFARRQRNSADTWVFGPNGEKFWGAFGAAGLLVHDSERGVLLQHRAQWSHHGGTWGLPGGARHEGEDAHAAALREAGEEAGVPADSVQIVGDAVFDLGYWSYTTVIAEARVPFDAVISDPESIAVEWVAIDRVGTLPLHPGFAASWPALQKRLSTVPTRSVPGPTVGPGAG